MRLRLAVRHHRTSEYGGVVEGKPQEVKDSDDREEQPGCRNEGKSLLLFFGLGERMIRVARKP